MSIGFVRESLLARRYDDGCTKPWLSILLPTEDATGIGTEGRGVAGNACGAATESPASISNDGTAAMVTP